MRHVVPRGRERLPWELVRGSRAVVGAGAVTLGAVLGGVLGEQIGLGATTIVGTGGGLFALLWLWWSPIRRLRDLPAIPDSDRS